jgi:primosomal protein N' (replication factor Y)
MQYLRLRAKVPELLGPAHLAPRRGGDEVPLLRLAGGAAARLPGVRVPRCGVRGLRHGVHRGRGAPHLPGYTVARVDADSVSAKGELKRTLDEFRAGKIDILLGTQMVAKGLNFPGVRLVGIALADTGLHMPDFRASERTFALITQVAGRAGRFFPDGRVLVQTWSPENPAIALAAAGDVEGFYAQELEQRRALGFPPFTRLVRLVFRSKEAAVAEEGAAGAAALIAPLLPPEADILGPAECPLALISGNHRFHLIVRGPAMAPLNRAVYQFLSQNKPPRALYIEADADPVSLL